MKRLLVPAVLLLGLLSAQSSQAGTEGVAAAKGVIIGAVMYEKCTGIQTTKIQQEKVIRVLIAQGATAEEVQQGFAEGVMYAEFSHPQKPTRSECREATQIHKATLSMIQ